MKRNERLVELSREHHTALKLARRLRQAGSSNAAMVAASESVRAQRAELEHHFDEEELTLLPILRRRAQDLGERLRAEHVVLRALLERTDDADALEQLGRLLEAHVRFEERVMFPCLEAHWADD